jgi:3-hydroxyisobutyrate dehydrogenase
MGRPMAERLAEAGNIVIGFDADPAARRECAASAHLEVVHGLLDVARSCRTVILMLPSSAVVEQVLLGDGLLDALAPSSTVIDMGSSDPHATQRLGAIASERGVVMIDAPVSGGVRGARGGHLTIMAGGLRSEVDRAGGLFSVLGSRVVYAGELGSGHAVKALNNLLAAASLLASAEALMIGTGLGLDPELMLEVFNSSTGRSYSTEHKLPDFILPQNYASGFAIGLLSKDIDIAARLADETRMTAPLSRQVRRLWTEAAETLGPAADHTEIACWLEQQSNAASDTASTR